MRIRTDVLILIISLLIPGLAVAGPFEDATKAYKSGDYKTAYRLMMPLAEQGNAVAQAKIGFLYDRGQGVPQDSTEAAKWYRRAAEQEDGSAQYALGVMYAEGHGVPQNYVLAHMWFSLSASPLRASPKYRAIAENGRDITASKMTPAQIAEAEKLAREWKPKKEK